MAEVSLRLRLYGLAAAIFALDQAAKFVVRASLPEWRTVPVIPGFFNLVHTENRGAAFGLLAEGSVAWRGLLLVGVSLAVMAGVAAVLWHPERGEAGRSAAMRYALAAVLGGALGNLCDRLLKGTVTDFVELYAGEFYWPAFNVADSALTIGIGAILLDLWLSRKRAKEA